jgi:EAL and modified HD-GYP domain-containing signal transduction protein
MASWLTRWFGRASNASAPATPAAPAASLPPAEPSAPAERVTVARRPLIDREGRLAGFEFPLSDVMARRVAQGADDMVLGAHAQALFAAMRPNAHADRVALVTLPLALLRRPAVAAHVPDHAWLATEPSPPQGDATLQALRERGVRLGASQVPQRGADFVRVDVTGLDRDAAAATIAACRAAAPRSRVVATGLIDVDEVEAVLAAGADLAAGHYEQMRRSAAGATLPPSTVRVCTLLNQVLHDADLAAIGAELRADVGLSYELLRHANSPLLGLQRRVEAADQAVMLLGRDHLYRWLCARLLGAAGTRPVARALQEIALARAALFEQLAPAVGATPSALYTLGLLSLLDVMVPMPMADALAPLRLPPETVQALVERSGPWSGLIGLAQCLERGDLAGAAPLAEPLGGLPAVTAAADQAWAFAREAASTLWTH